MIFLSTKSTKAGKRFGYYTEASNGNKKSGVFKHTYNSKQAAIKAICSDARDYGTAPYFDICDVFKGVNYRMVWNPEKKKYEKSVLPNESSAETKYIDTDIVWEKGETFINRYKGKAVFKKISS